MSEALARALDLHRAGRVGAAILLYQDLLRSNPRSPDALHLLGVALHQIGRPERAPELIRAAIALRPEAQELHNNLGLVLRDLGRLREALASFEEAARLLPHHPEATLNIARIQNRLGRPAEALVKIASLGPFQPGNADFWLTRGTAQRGLGDPGAALIDLSRSVRCAPGRSEPWLQRGATLLALERWQAAERDLRHALVLAPGLGEAWSFLGYRDMAGIALDAAEHRFRRALLLAPNELSAVAGLAEVRFAAGDAAAAVSVGARVCGNERADPHYRFRHGIHRLAAGDLETGWREYDRIYHRSDAIRRNGLPRRWDGGSLSGRRLLVCAEQGVGDELLFTAHLEALVDEAGDVLLECDPRLVGLFRRSFPKVLVHAYDRGRHLGRPAHRYGWVPPDRRPDVYAEAGLAFARRHRSVAEAEALARPWLVPDPDRLAAMRAWLDGLGPEPKIGFSWRSRVLTGVRAPHYPGLATLAPLLRTPGVRFVSLQYGEGWREELAAAGADAVIVPDLDTTADIDGVAALVAGLDLLICPSSTLVWIASGLGQPVWMLYNHPIFLGLGTDRLPGFPSLRGFPKTLAEPWSGPVAAACRALRAWQAGTDPLSASATGPALGTRSPDR